MGISPESHEEQALQAHSIRQTTTCLFQLLPEALHVIPTTDNSSVRLPEEPFTALSRLYVLRELKRPYDEEAIECVGSDEISEDVLDSKTSMTPLPPTTSPTCVSLASEMGVLSFRRGLDGSNFTTLSPEEQNEVLSLRHWSHRTSEHLVSAEWGVVIEKRRGQFDEANIHFHRSPKGTAIRKQYENEKNRLRTALLAGEGPERRA
ncbi:hypothetical protein F5878DRAFT_658406 [Lentinula raphanica]|uniref:Uncharacterized protein n=1 Tax=Lentinula raphanica TaxID=153919 RepID=A0AA38PER4_9AGAR|nr:hypothetical protein F5878DRAFT_658406 [Lentinula raphanica]